MSGRKGKKKKLGNAAHTFANAAYLLWAALRSTDYCTTLVLWQYLKPTKRGRWRLRHSVMACQLVTASDLTVLDGTARSRWPCRVSACKKKLLFPPSCIKTPLQHLPCHGSSCKSPIAIGNHITRCYCVSHRIIEDEMIYPSPLCSFPIKTNIIFSPPTSRVRVLGFPSIIMAYLLATTT